MYTKVYNSIQKDDSSFAKVSGIMAAKKLVIPPKRYQGLTSVVSARLPNEMIQSLDQVAERTGRNRNEIIQICLEFAIDNLETGTGKKGGST